MIRVLLAIFLVCPTDIFAEERFAEITPFIGYRFGGTFEQEQSEAEYELNDSPSFGLIVNIRHQDPTQWEIFYSQQKTEAEFLGATTNDPEVDIDLHVLQLGGTYQFEGELARPYLVGMKFLPTSRVGFRVEARAYGTLVSSSTDLFCSTGPDANVCAIRLEGKMLSQVETFAGITVRF
jgi:hypothetical protein